MKACFVASSGGHWEELMCLKAIADEKGWLYVDFYSILDDGQGGLSQEHSKDGCHPNVQAYLLMEALLMEVLQ